MQRFTEIEEAGSAMRYDTGGEIYAEWNESRLQVVLLSIGTAPLVYQLSTEVHVCISCLARRQEKYHRPFEETDFGVVWRMER